MTTYNQKLQEFATDVRLNYLREQIEKECISYGEVAELQNYHKEIYALGDVVLAEWAGISEDDWNKNQHND